MEIFVKFVTVCGAVKMHNRLAFMKIQFWFGFEFSAIRRVINYVC